MEKMHGKDVLLFEYLCKIPWPVSETFHAFTTWERAPPWHILFCRSAYKAEYELCLIEITVTGEDWLSLEHFTKNTSVYVRYLTKKA